jgi:hypothetical protein
MAEKQLNLFGDEHVPNSKEPISEEVAETKDVSVINKSQGGLFPGEHLQKLPDISTKPDDDAAKIVEPEMDPYWEAKLTEIESKPKEKMPDWPNIGRGLSSETDR